MSDFFNLPPPWNPGYSLPQNVHDEGLERHAYVTQQKRNGTYDDPKVGYGGYAVPEYVKEEGYGKGALITRWAPRGSYAGPRVPHWLDTPSAIVARKQRLPNGSTKVTIKAMGDAAPVGPPLPPDPSKPIPTSSGGIDSTTLMLLGAAGVAYILLRKKR